MRKQFRETLTRLSGQDERIIVLLGDVSVYLFNEYKNKFPERFYNVGICENTLVSLSAGLSSQGFIPFAHTITPFITERSYEQIKLDLCYNKLAANIVTCGGSFDYAWDGATHHCYTDLAILRLLPDMQVMQPGSQKELDILLESQYNNGKPNYFRLSDHPHNIDMPVEFGRATVLKDTGSDLTVMTAGPILQNVLEACKDLSVNLVYFHTLKPIDKDAIHKFINTKILVIHDAFGLYESICGIPGVSAVYHGLRDEFCSCYGTLHEVRKMLGLDVTGIRNEILKNLSF